MARKAKDVVEYRHYHLPMEFPVLLISGKDWKISATKSSRLHFHNCMELGICHSDSGTIDFEGQSVHFKAGDIVCIPRHVPHTTYSDPGKESLWSYIFFDPETLFSNQFLQDIQILSAPQTYQNHYCYLIHQEDEAFFYSLVLGVIRELRAKPEHYELATKGLLMTICIELGRIQKTLPKQERTVSDNAMVITPALDFIQTHYMENFSVSNLAEMCHLSETHFRRLFHTIMGYSPLDFIISTRIDKACNLLRSTEHSVLSISEQVGFHSISSFNRCFSKMTGQSPRSWRNMIHSADRETKEKQMILDFNGWMHPEKL